VERQADKPSNQKFPGGGEAGFVNEEWRTDTG
jgi:hypothetical protein